MEEIKLPPPERAAKTAIGAGSSGKGTVGSYLKADALFSEKGGKKLDYGSGRGEGAKLIKADTYEPYVKSKPKYNDAKKIPSASYNKVTSLNVLNVLPPEARSEAVKNIGRILTVNGEAVISTRGVKDVESAKNKVKIKDGYIIGKGNDARFQKGFTAQELKNYVQKTLGKGFIVESAKGIGKAAIKIKKLSIPKGLGGVTRQEGTPVINIQEKLLFNPRQNFSSGGDVMENKMLSLSELEMFFKEYGYYHDTDPRNSMNTEGKDLANPEVQKDIAKQLEDRKKLDVISALPISRKAGKTIKKERLEEALEKGKALNINKGGSMSKQMELFNEGGLKDEGGTVDPVSGNDVPPGSTQEEVRDDIPAQLSEGEFVFPADVVRYIGLEKLMRLRQEAKQGLKQMEAMGQMGNSDEATMPDDLPFDMTDLDIEDDLEYNTGGVVQAQQGTYLAPTIPTQYRNESIETTNPMGMQQIQAGLNRGVNAPASYVPNMGRMYTPQAQAYAPVSYTDFLGTSAAGAPQTETVRYFNEATGQTRMIPHVVNPDGSRGPTLYPVPQGFVIQEEAPKEEAKKTKVESAKVKPVDAGDDSSDQEQRERDEAMYGRGAGRISLGGDIKPGTTVKTGFLGKGTSSLTTGSTTFGIGYDLPGGVLPGIATIKAITAGTGNLPDGATGKFTLGGVTLTKSAEVTNAIIKNPMGDIARSLIEEHEQARKAAQGLISSGLSRRDAIKITEGFYGGTEASKAAIKEAVEEAVKTDKGFLGLGGDDSVDMDKFNNLPDTVKEAYYEASSDREEDRPTTGVGTVSPGSIDLGYEDDRDDERQDYGTTTTSTPSFSPPSDAFADSSSDDNEGSGESSGGGFDSNTGGGGSDDYGSMFKQGGLAGKKKPKPKKMKRGGLASR